MDRGAWQATVPGVAELDMTEQLTLSLSNKLLLWYKLSLVVLYLSLNLVSNIIFRILFIYIKCPFFP